VIESRDPSISPGEVVQGYWGWQTVVTGRLSSEGADATGTSIDQILNSETVAWRVNPAVQPVSAALHVLGEMGITGYVGLTAIGRPQPGDLVFVSSAAGTVGSVVGQVAKNLGCRAIGSVGSDAKATYIQETLGYDAAVNYKADDLEQQIDMACPDGIDVYFDNVGGPISDLVIDRLRPRGRVVLCGSTAAWTASGPDVGPRIYWQLLARRAIVEGFSLPDHPEKYADALVQLEEWLREGKLVARETFVDGFENLPSAFIDFLRGHYLGKVMIRLSPTDGTEPE
jgi:NADPH-dependent curcumin reductase CurA